MQREDVICYLFFEWLVLLWIEVVLWRRRENQSFCPLTFHFIGALSISLAARKRLWCQVSFFQFCQIQKMMHDISIWIILPWARARLSMARARPQRLIWPHKMFLTKKKKHIYIYISFSKCLIWSTIYGISFLWGKNHLWMCRVIINCYNPSTIWLLDNKIQYNRCLLLACGPLLSSTFLHTSIWRNNGKFLAAAPGHMPSSE